MLCISLVSPWVTSCLSMHSKSTKYGPYANIYCTSLNLKLPSYSYSHLYKNKNSILFIYLFLGFCNMLFSSVEKLEIRAKKLVLVKRMNRWNFGISCTTMLLIWDYKSIHIWNLQKNLFYHLKIHFIIYTIPFFNTPNIPTFIFL